MAEQSGNTIETHENNSIFSEAEPLVGESHIDGGSNVTRKRERATSPSQKSTKRREISCNSPTPSDLFGSKLISQVQERLEHLNGGSSDLPAEITPSLHISSSQTEPTSNLAEVLRQQKPSSSKEIQVYCQYCYIVTRKVQFI